MLSEEDQISFFTNIRNGDVKAVGDFIDDNEESAPFNNEVGESAAAVALKSRQLAIYETLISKAWILDSNENFNEIVDDLENILISELREIYEQITQNPNDLTSLIDAFLDRNRYILPNNYEEGKSAVAMEFARLISEGGRNINVIAKRFDSAFKSELREIHKRNFIKNPNEEHLITLITRTRIYFGGSPATTNRPKYLGVIAQAYEELNEVPEIRAILKVVANVKKLKVIFDFNSDRIDHADPTARVPGNVVNGIAYAVIGHVYIGAKADHSEVLGLLAHELCHIAMFHIYNNNYKPYFKNDSKGEKDIESFLVEYKQMIGIEKCIDIVHEYPEQFRHNELIVRVPHLLALYQQDNNNMESLKKSFKNLFDYFEKKTLPDLNNENDLMSAVWKLKQKEPQYLKDSKILCKPKSFEVGLDTNKVLEISTNCPQLTTNMIFQGTMNKSELNFLFLGLYHLKDRETNELLLDAHSSCMKPTIVINCDNEIEKDITKIADNLKKDKISERIIFIHNHKESLIKDATLLTENHEWNELTDQSKENLIKRMINFQGEKILLGEVVDCHYDAIDLVPLKELLDNYLKIGNELKFPEIDIHVQRKFLNDKSEIIEISQILKIAENTKCILLSDDPGMGKTTELKSLAMEFKKKLKSFWVSFVDLKGYSDFYEKDENFQTEFNSSQEIANFFAEKIFKLNEFEEKVFKHLFCDDRVVLLLDGFDEISPSFKKFVAMLIKSIRKHSTNILITSTRPHLKEELCRELNVEAFTFLPLSMKNCEEILKLGFENNEIAEEAMEKNFDQAIDFFKRLNQSSSRPIKNPLILRMIAKVFSDDKFAKSTQPNIFSIFENFTNIMIMESMKKGHDARQEAANCLTSDFNIIRFYQKEAFIVLSDIDNCGYNYESELLLFETEHDFKRVAEIKFKKCFDLWFSEVQSPPDEQITRIALMKSDCSGKFQFIHRTFAEFFVADFIFKNVFDLKALKESKENIQMQEERLEAIFEIVREVFDSFSVIRFVYFFLVRIFIDGAFESLIIQKEIIERKKIFSKFFNIFTRDRLPSLFESLVSYNLFNLVTVITRCASQQEQKRLWMHKGLNGTNVFMWAAGSGSLYFNKKLNELAHEVLDEKNILNFFTEKSENGETVVSLAYNNKRHDVFEFYVKKELFPSPYESFPDTEFYLKTVKKIDEVIRERNVEGLQEELEKVNERFGLENLKYFVNSWTAIGATIYLFTCQCYCLSSIEEFKKMWKLLQRILSEKDFKILLKKPNRYGLTPLMWKANHSKKEVFISFWSLLTEGLTDEEIEKILNEEQWGRNSFDLATLNRDHETFLVVKDLYLKIFGVKKMRIMLMREKKKGESILHSSHIYDEETFETVKALWKFIQEIFDVSTQKTILMKTDNIGNPFYEEIVKRKDFNKKIKIFEPFIKQNLTTVEKLNSKME